MAHELTLDLSSLEDRAMGRWALPRAARRGLDKRLARALSAIESERRAGQHRYRALAEDRVLRRAIQDFATRARRGTENLVVLGIGGSALGTLALHQALCHPQYNLLSRHKRGGPRLFVMDNVDPVHFAGLLELLDGALPRTLFNIISKSGETAETAAQFMIVRDLLQRKLGPRAARGRVVVTTDARAGTLRDIANQEGYASLPVPEGVGGRFSVLSAVGLFPAAMCGIDIRNLLQGAAAMDRRVRRNAPASNPAALFAAINYLCYQRGQPMVVMMPYSNGLYGMADWFRQLWAESLGKALDAGGRKRVHIGPTPIKALGATDQHSQIQLYREGPNDKLIVFLEVHAPIRDVPIPRRQFSNVPAMSYLGGRSLQALLAAEKKATELALVHSQRPCLTIRFPVNSAHTLGQFICLMQAATTLTARLFGINAYDQPGVELGKEITYHLLGREGYARMPST